jgi:NitT/TauT family transport system permease protein
MADVLERELAGLDHLEATPPPSRSHASRFWAAMWPKLIAVGIVLAIWQILIWREWKPEYVFASPADVFGRRWDDLHTSEFWRAVGHTGRRAIVGFTLSLVIGGVIGIALSRSRVLRVAIGAIITGLQTMPSIAWFPLAILLFQLSEQAITFVVVLGAAPSIANGLITGVDHTPPLLVRVGTMMGANRWQRLRHVMLPAAMPSFVGGLKQGWAFAWRSLMAGELIVILGPSVGFLLQQYRNLADAAGLIAMMIVILVVGILVDALVFGTLDRIVRRRHGLTEER